MRKIATALAVLSFVVPLLGARPAQAQLLEGLVFGALSAAYNKEAAHAQERTESAVKVVFDVYYVGNGSGEPRYFTSWDPTTQTSVWFGDGVALRVKPYTNTEPSREMGFFVNDRLIDWRKVEGGKSDDGRICKNDGVIGGYPLIYIKDLDMGFNQIKVRLSRQEYGSATFIRLDAPSFFQLAADENARLSIGGAGQGTFPVLQSYTGMMPDGTLRNFLSLDELKATLAKANADAVSAVQSRNVNSATGSVSRTQPPEPEQPQGGASACPPSKPACSPKPPVATTVTMENRRLALHLDPGECLPRVGDAVVIVDGAGCVVSRLTVDSVGVCRFKAVGKVPTDLRSGNYRVMPDRPNGH